MRGAFERMESLALSFSSEAVKLFSRAKIRPVISCLKVSSRIGKWSAVVSNKRYEQPESDKSLKPCNPSSNW